MRVPDLDWPTDLFSDVLGDDEAPVAPAPAATAPTTPLSLWPTMRRLWIGDALPADAAVLAA